MSCVQVNAEETDFTLKVAADASPFGLSAVSLSGAWSVPSRCAAHLAPICLPYLLVLLAFPERTSLRTASSTAFGCDVAKSLLDICTLNPAGKTLGRDSALRMLASIARSPATDGVTLVGSGGLKTVLALLVAKPSADNASTREAAMEVVRAMVTQNGVTRRGHLVRFRSCLVDASACLPCFHASGPPSLGLIPLEPPVNAWAVEEAAVESTTGRGVFTKLLNIECLVNYRQPETSSCIVLPLANDKPIHIYDPLSSSSSLPRKSESLPSH